MAASGGRLPDRPESRQSSRPATPAKKLGLHVQDVLQKIIAGIIDHHLKPAGLFRGIKQTNHLGFFGGVGDDSPCRAAGGDNRAADRVDLFGGAAGDKDMVALAGKLFAPCPANTEFCANADNNSRFLFAPSSPPVLSGQALALGRCVIASYQRARCAQAGSG